MKKTNILIFLTLFILSACTEDEQESNEVIFKVSLTEAKDYSATVTITHNGTNRNCYYGFWVSGSKDDIQGEINKYLSTADKSKILSSLKNQRKKVVSLSGLKPTSEFTYIVFGINEDGELYGVPDAVEFKTTERQWSAEINENWSIKYLGDALYNNGYYSKFKVNVNKSSTDHYFVFECDIDTYNTFTNEEDFITYAIEEFKKENIDDDENEQDFWLLEDFLAIESIYHYHYLDPNDYIAYAIGVNPDGSPSGLYVKSEPFSVKEYKATKGFDNLLSNEWKITNNEDVTYNNIRFEKLKVNQSLLMYGWGNHPFPIVVNYNQNSRNITIPTQLVKENAEFIIDGTTIVGDLYMQGWYMNLKDELELTSKSSDLNLATGKFNEEADAYGFYTTIVITYPAFGVKQSIGGITYVLHSNDGSRTILGRSYIEFPFAMIKM